MRSVCARTCGFWRDYPDTRADRHLHLLVKGSGETILRLEPGIHLQEWILRLIAGSHGEWEYAFHELMLALHDVLQSFPKGEPFTISFRKPASHLKDNNVFKILYRQSGLRLVESLLPNLIF